MDRLSLALWLQCGTLVTTALALFLEGWGASVGWLALALGSIEAGRRLSARGLTIFGLVVGGLAVARVACIDSWLGAPSNTILLRSPVMLTGAAALGLLAMAASITAAYRLSVRRHGGSPPAPLLGRLLLGLGALLWLGTWLLQESGTTTTLLWLAAPAALLAVHRVGPRLGHVLLAVATLGMTAAHWGIVDMATSRFGGGWDPGAGAIVFNARMGLALLIAGVAFWTARAVRGSIDAAGKPNGVMHQLLVLATIIVPFVGLSFELDAIVSLRAQAVVAWSLPHVRGLCLTALWTIAAGTIAVSSRLLERNGTAPTIVRVAAWLVLIGCSAKWLVVDTLGFAVSDAAAREGLRLVVNTQIAVGLLIAGAALAVRSLLAGAFKPLPAMMRPAGWILVGAVGVVLWGLSFEVDRILEHLADTGSRLGATWSFDEVRVFWLLALWSTGGAVMLVIGRARRVEPLVMSGTILTVASGLAWIGVATAYRVGGIGDAVPIGNLQFAVGAGLFAALLLTAHLVRGLATMMELARFPATATRFAIGVGTAMLLWMGSFEIDHAMSGERVQAALSVYWCVFAVALVVIGFVRPLAIARYVGLGLLGATALKVVVVDMSGIDQMWRVLSFLGCGLLLIATSMVYARLSPRLTVRETARDRISAGAA